MEMKKQYLKSRPICKVTFKLSKDATKSAESVNIVGDFNNWDQQSTPMKSLKNGDYTIKMDLPVGREYEFRYLIDGSQWENDWHADKYVHSSIPGVENSVVVV